MAVERRVIDNGGSPDGPIRNRWWLEDEPGEAMIRVARHIELKQEWRYERHLRWAKLYANQDLRSLYTVGTFTTNIDTPGIAWNACRAVVDTIEARIAKNTPRVMFLTSGGNHAQQQRAKGLTKFVDGVFEECRGYDHTRRAFLDAMVFDGGAVKVLREGSEIKLERILPHELLIDEAENIYGEPRTGYQRKFLHRDAVASAFGRTPELRAAIMNASPVMPESLEAAEVTDSDTLAVYEGWRVSDENGEGGRHVIAVDGVKLVDEPWRKQWLPIEPILWSRRPVGYWGQGLIEQLVGIQLEINKLLRVIANAQNRIGSTIVLTPMGSNIVTDHIRQDVTFLKYAGDRAPQFATPAAVTPEIYRHLDTLWSKAFEIAGVSQLSALGQKPPGLDAAVAMRTFHDIESERFAIPARAFEEFHVRLARRIIDVAQDAYSASRTLVVRAPGTRLLEEIDFSKVRLREDQYIMRSFPVSKLSNSPEGRMQQVVELFQAGFLDRETALKTLDFPDLEDALDLRLASIEDIRRILDGIVVDGEYEPPEPFMDLQTALRMCQSIYLKSRGQKVDGQRLAMLRQWMDECVAIQDQVRPPPPPAPAGAPLDPAAMPAAVAPTAMPEQMVDPAAAVADAMAMSAAADPNAVPMT